MPRLESEVSRSVRAICEHADTLSKKREYDFAISKYFEALGLIPDPKKDYVEATFIYTSIGETYWKLRDYHNAGAQFLKALRSVGGDRSARINLRLGQCLYECGEIERSAAYMCQAYMIDGEDAFDGEDPKYFESIRYEVEGAPDDDFLDSIDDLNDVTNDLYLVDTVLGDGPAPPEYEDGVPEDDIVDGVYDGGYDETEEILSGRESEYGADIENGRYFGEDEEEDDYDGEDTDYYEEPLFRRILNWFLDLFK